MMESIHMKNNSQIRWKTKQLKFDRSENRSQYKVPSNQVAKSLIANGKEEKHKKFQIQMILSRSCHVQGPKKTPYTFFFKKS